MARPKVTEAALRKARELAAQSKNGRQVVGVSWQPPTYDNKRGSEGQTVWTHSHGKWTAFVGELKFVDKTHVTTRKIGGLEFFFALPNSGPSLDELTIDYADGEFIVTQRAI
jgi:hypothetical protein